MRTLIPILITLWWLYPPHGPETTFNVYGSTVLPPQWLLITNVAATEVDLPVWPEVELMLFRVAATNSVTLTESQ